MAIQGAIFKDNGFLGEMIDLFALQCGKPHPRGEFRPADA
jgi:hypothetical protein